jgi:hypothetical protein
VTQGLALSTSLDQQFMIPHTLPEKGGIVVFDGPVSFKCGIIHKRIELLAIPTTARFPGSHLKKVLFSGIAFRRRLIGPISAFGARFKSSKYRSIYHDGHWLRWHLRVEPRDRLDLEPKSVF